MAIQQANKFSIKPSLHRNNPFVQWYQQIYVTPADYKLFIRSLFSFIF